jgi:hypothetical protein
LEITKRSVKNIANLKQFLYRSITGPEGSSRLRFPDFETIGHRHQSLLPSLSFQKIVLVLNSASGRVELRNTMLPEGLLH